jgi:hypothetical protein
MRTDRSHSKHTPHLRPIAALLAAVFLVTAVVISPALAKHDRDDEDEQYGSGWHHEHKEHHKHWHEYEQHVYFPPPVVNGPPPGIYAPPPPVVYAPPIPTINVVIPLPVP